ncbi:Haloacid dehalogenase-like hydrolase domain-containing protein 3 [Phytophthora pseudosyringae]|uniref:Haloacid dehalogenase-like hydrolase domain-containing protein 3 n=1 Tax=Phytophthora pseudosyringae TaxID=221518 RepID=A0A8T1VQ86_9STRA|nr:Haloacid dehalogenase-like hydrolase domain-containing protein 3 [Phytophthora pseudosyringae]
MAYVTVTIVVAVVWKFPIPFGYVLMVGPYVVLFTVFTVFVISPRVLRHSPVLRQQITAQLKIIATQGLVAVAYPVFSAIFNRLSGAQQAAFICVMPIIKFSMKQMIANVTVKLHEYVGPIVVFSVDVFNVFYVAICMQVATSTFTTLIIVGSDNFHVILALRDIFRSVNAMQRGCRSSRPEERIILLHDLPAMVQNVCQYMDLLQARKHHIRLHAPFPLPLSDKSKRLLEECYKTLQSPTTRPTRASAPHPSTSNLNFKCSSKPVLQRANTESPSMGLTRLLVVPARKMKPQRIFIFTLSITESPDFCPAASDEKEKAVRDALQTLFHSEYVLMAEYVEFMLPMLYALYLATIYHLPVAAYYPHTASMTDEKLGQTVANILVFSAIEFVAFAVLLTVLRRKFGFLPLCQLSFVLETQRHSVQGHLLVWNLYILHLTVVHYGVDFTAPFT